MIWLREETKDLGTKGGFYGSKAKNNALNQQKIPLKKILGRIIGIRGNWGEIALSMGFKAIYVIKGEKLGLGP